MSQTARQSLASARDIVVKLGTQLLSDESGAIDSPFLRGIADQIATLRERGMRVTLVSSGAIGSGLRELKLSKRPSDLGRLQAIAAVGQRRLMDVWADAFEPHKLPVAQLLLTREDVDHRARFLNVRNTIHAAHELGAIPIINENDTISTDELIKITFGDNDILAALVAGALRADLLILLSTVDGLLDASGHRVPLVENLDQISHLVRNEKSMLGKGGMPSKLEAARIVTSAGEPLVVAGGRAPNVLPRILDGEEIGTLFVPSRDRRSARSRWIGARRTSGTIIIDPGAVRALVERNKSLLPAGIVRVEGTFQPGDAVAIADASGQIIARGLSNYSAEDVERIKGRKSADARALMGQKSYDEVVHRDNLVL
jgi:glutamate 5-kinase